MNPTLLQSVVRVADARTPDADLLSRFTRNRDERAFEELVRRHGPLVWAICRHLLTHHADAEDAFQAVFLALVRGASSIHVGKALPAWLHGVAVRVATKARRSAVRRRQREQRAAVPEADWPVPDESWATLMTAVHEEIRQLPEVERTAFVLCDLEGVRQPDAAARLGWPLGTLSGRLCKARQRLLDQLTRRGIAPTVLGVGGIAGVAGTVPAALLQRVTSFPTAKVGVSSTVAELARGLVEGTTMRMKIVAATLLVVGALGMSGGALVLSQADAQTGGGNRGGPVPGGAPGGGGFPPRGGAENPPGPGGRPGAPGPGRPSTGLLSGEGSGMMGSGMATMGGSPSWEYKFVDLKGDDRDTFTKAITDAGRDGWEFGGSERLRKGGEPQLVLVFKKPKGIGFHLGGAGMGMPGMGAFGGGGMGMPGAGGGSSFGGGRGGAGGFELPMMGLGGGDARFGGAAGVEARTFKLKNTGAGDVAKAVETSSAFKGKTFKVIAEPVSNMIIVVADIAAMKEITRVIEELDAKPNHVPAGPGRGPPPAGGGTGSSSARPAPGGVAGLNPMGGPGGAPARGEIRIIRLNNATAQEMSPVIGRVFPNADVTPEPRSNQLIIRSDDTTSAEIEALITRLDVEGPLKR